MPQSGDYSFLLRFELTICLWMVNCSGWVVKARRDTIDYKQFTCKLNAVVQYDVCWYAVRDDQ